MNWWLCQNAIHIEFSLHSVPKGRVHQWLPEVFATPMRSLGPVSDEADSARRPRFHLDEAFGHARGALEFSGWEVALISDLADLCASRKQR